MVFQYLLNESMCIFWPSMKVCAYSSESFVHLSIIFTMAMRFQCMFSESLCLSSLHHSVLFHICLINVCAFFVLTKRFAVAVGMYLVFPFMEVILLMRKWILNVCSMNVCAYLLYVLIKLTVSLTKKEFSWISILMNCVVVGFNFGL